MPTTAEVPVRETTPEDIADAEQAAREAALSLHEARQQRPKIDRLADAIEKANRDNGFSDLVRRAFGS